MSSNSQETLRFRVEIPSDGMSAWLRIEPGCPADEITKDVVAALLSARDVRLDRQGELRLQEFLDAYNPDDHTKDGVRCQLVSGQLPVHGTDGHFETDEQLCPQNKVVSQSHTKGEQTKADEHDSAVDHYARTAFRVVPKGHHIGTIRPPSPGQDGIDVRGKIIPSCPGKSCPITAGTGTELMPDGRIVSTISGQLKIVGNAVRVESRLQIAEYVDFSVGHVDFPGDVAVGQGVRDRFTVHAGGSLKIGGLVEAATVMADVDVVLAGGISGRDKGRVRAGRDAIVRYADSCRLIAGRDLRVQKELNACQVLVRGRLDSDQCKISGGTLWLLRGGKVASIGSSGGVETNVIVGRIGPLDALLSRINTELTAVGRHEASFAQTVDALRTHPSRADQHILEKLMMAQMQLTDARNRQGRLLEAQKRIKASAAKHADADLHIRSRLFHGVRIWIGEQCLAVRADLKGPLRIWVDPSGQAFVTDGVDGSTRNAGEVLEILPVAEMPDWIDENDTDDDAEDQAQQPERTTRASGVGGGKVGGSGATGGGSVGGSVGGASGGGGRSGTQGGKAAPSKHQSPKAA